MKIKLIVLGIAVVVTFSSTLRIDAQQIASPEQVDAWKRTAKAAFGDLRALETRSTAVYSLATHYMASGNWDEAINWWLEWNPPTGCGLGHAETSYRRSLMIIKCHLNAGRTEVAIGLMEGWVFEERFLCGHEIPLTLVDTFRNQKRLSRLEEKMKERFGEKQLPQGAQIAMDYIQILKAGRAKNVEELWKCLGEFQLLGLEIHHDWKSQTALQQLVALGKEAKPFLLKKIKGDWNSSLWVMEALARMGDSDVIPFLKEKIAETENCWALYGYYRILTFLGTDEAYALLQHYIDQSPDGSGNHHTCAKQILEKYPQAKR